MIIGAIKYQPDGSLSANFTKFKKQIKKVKFFIVSTHSYLGKQFEKLLFECVNNSLVCFVLGEDGCMIV